MMSSHHSRRRLTTVAALATMLTVSACGQANIARQSPSSTSPGFPLTLTNCGHTLQVATPPQRAITTDQSSTETLLALGLQERMVGTSNLKTTIAPAWEPAYRKIPVLTPKILTPELTASANPDLVVASFHDLLTAERAGTREALTAKGISSYVSEAACAPQHKTIANPIDGMFADYSALGRLFGVEPRAQELIAEQRKVVDAVAQRKPTGAPPRVLMVYSNYAGQPYVAGKDGLAHALIVRAGGVNVLETVPGVWVEVAWEKLAESNPDLIVVADLAGRGRPGDKPEEKISALKQNPATASLEAVTQGRFVVIPGVELDPSVRFPHALQLLSDDLVTRGKLQ